MNREIVLARSKAGHDKNHVYLIWAQDAEYLYLVNGTTKRLSAPKKKKRMHVQLIKKIPPAVREFLNEQNMLGDETVAKMLELYHRRNEDVESRCN